MKTPTSNITKFTQSAANGLIGIIVFGIMFPIFCVYQLISIVSKEISKTRETSVESKIHPKNTREVEEDFGIEMRDENGMPLGLTKKR